MPAFWRRACEHALYGGPGATVLWVGFSLSQLCRLQGADELITGEPCPAPQHWPNVTVGPGAPHASSSGRIYWINGETGEPGKQPSNSNYFCLLGGNRAQRQRFRERFGAYGHYEGGRRGLWKAKPRNAAALIMIALRGRALQGRASMSKSAIARAVGVRKATALRAVDELVARGAVIPHDKGFALARCYEAEESPKRRKRQREPRKRRKRQQR